MLIKYNECKCSNYFCTYRNVFLAWTHLLVLIGVFCLSSICVSGTYFHSEVSSSPSGVEFVRVDLDHMDFTDLTDIQFVIVDQGGLASDEEVTGSQMEFIAVDRGDGLGSKGLFSLLSEVLTRSTVLQGRMGPSVLILKSESQGGKSVGEVGPSRGEEGEGEVHTDDASDHASYGDHVVAGPSDTMPEEDKELTRERDLGTYFLKGRNGQDVQFRRTTVAVAKLNDSKITSWLLELDVLEPEIKKQMELSLYDRMVDLKDGERSIWIDEVVVNSEEVEALKGVTYGGVTENKETGEKLRIGYLTRNKDGTQDMVLEVRMSDGKIIKQTVRAPPKKQIKERVIKVGQRTYLGEGLVGFSVFAMFTIAGGILAQSVSHYSEDIFIGLILGAVFGSMLGTVVAFLSGEPLSGFLFVRRYRGRIRHLFDPDKQMEESHKLTDKGFSRLINLFSEDLFEKISHHRKRLAEERQFQNPMHMGESL